MVDLTCLEAALGYANAGCFVFPAKPGERKSRMSKRNIADGKNWGMSNNPDTIKANWRKYPDSNVCIVTGEFSKLFVVEVDTKDGHKLLEDGQVVLDRLIAANGGEWPDTRICQTPSGGKHYYFVYPECQEGQYIIIRNSASKLGLGIDVRGDGGMVLAPPSIKPGVNLQYQWISAEGVGIRKAPQWLLDLVIEKDVTREMNEPQAAVEKIAAALELLPNDGINVEWLIEQDDGSVKIRKGFDGWNDIGMACHRATGGSDAGYLVFDAFSAKNKAKYNKAFTRYSWYRRWIKSPPTKIGAGTIFKLANYVQPGWNGMWEEAHHVDEPYYNDEDHPYADAEQTSSDGNGATPPPKAKTKSKRNKRFVVQIRAGDNDLAADETEKCLIEANIQFFVQGNSLVRPIIREMDVYGSKNKTNVTILYDVEADYLTYICGQLIEYQVYNLRKKEWVPTDPPPKVMQTLLAKVGHWDFPTITGVISTPTMRPDGSLLIKEGYDPITRLLLTHPPQMPNIFDKPSRGVAIDAIELLESLLSEFPFTSDIAKSVALSAIITPVVRGAFPVTPMYVNRAPIAASGKSYLFDVVATIATGQRMPVIAAGRNDEETEKRLGAALIGGQALISIDNVNGELGGDALCQYIERQMVSVRVLGKTENRIIEPRSTTFFCTGNNIMLTGDITRRCVTSVLDPAIEHPELREFKQNPIAMILQDRGKYVAACLTICKSYMAHGSPNRVKPLGSFEAWSDIVRCSLIWLGRADPVNSMEQIRSEDPDLIAHNAVLHEMCNVIGIGLKHKITLAKIIEIASEPDLGNNFSRYGDNVLPFRNTPPLWPDLHEAIMRVASMFGRPPDANRLGKWARSKKNKIVDGLCLRGVSVGNNTAKWYVEKVSDPSYEEDGAMYKHETKQKEEQF